MSDITTLLTALTLEQQRALLAALQPPTVTTPEPVVETPTPAARLTDADFCRDLSAIASGRRDPTEGARQRQVIPGGSAIPPSPDVVSRRDPIAFTRNLADIAAGKVRVA